ncbi:MAG: aconitate hydratase AcnA [Asgard group archaeon]|nr:aconitate hydratase AcnA [Asgard group archaeon]
MELIYDQLEITEKFSVGNKEYLFYDLSKLSKLGISEIEKLPFTIRILLEAIVRNFDGKIVTQEDVLEVGNWNPKGNTDSEIPHKPTRVILQDFTGVPAVVDLAAMRSAMERFGGDPTKINPLIPVDLVIDHSIQVDYYGTKDAREKNEEKEFERNNERYRLLKWAQQSFDNFRVVPPGRGIVHQVNLEYLAPVIQTQEINGKLIAYPDTLVGTDSHTTMINGLGVLGWGVGGIEAEAVMLGQPYYMPVPDVIGVRLIGELKDKVTATDLVLTITQMLREYGVVGKFVEFFGPSLEKLSLPDRATISNMSPEYGATCGFFPIDKQTVNYLELSGRTSDQIELIKKYAEVQNLYYNPNNPEPNYTDVLELDLSSVKTSLAGPKRPQDRIPLSEMKNIFHRDFEKTYCKDISVHQKLFDEDQNRWNGEGGSIEAEHRCQLDSDYQNWLESKPQTKSMDWRKLSHGSVVIAAITSCTNTSNPTVLIGAGLLAKNAQSRGLKVEPFVKTSLAPGSRVVTEYLRKSGLLTYLEELGFNIVGYGCTTCIGNSGPLDEDIAKEIKKNDLIVASVLSGNRNFEGRINPLTKANYLASPILVVAYALAGTVHIDFDKEPIGVDQKNNPVYLKDIWPSNEQVQKIVDEYVTRDLFKQQYSEIFHGTENWIALKTTIEKSFQWDNSSTYIREPPFFIDFPLEIPESKNISNARVIALLGNTITTDHISPAGVIPENDPAGLFLKSQNIQPRDFNSFGSRRGNHEVMIRGTFGNIRLRNKLSPDKEGGWTKYLPTNEEMVLYDAAMKYQENNIPLIVIAGKEYGTGSSRDWAAKGTQLLGIKAVIAESYERIHRSNLVGMGVLPLEFTNGENYETLGITGEEVFDIIGIDKVTPKTKLTVTAKRSDGSDFKFEVLSRLDSQVEIDYYKNGGILHTVLRNLVKN